MTYTSGVQIVCDGLGCGKSIQTRRHKVKEALEAYGWKQVGEDGYEAKHYCSTCKP